ncbi:MAG: glycoside hydrolase 43 family protein [Chitinophagaceae bacterium]|nr:glycoside hydrolase 43 family protein [Chitinophagaceae bacterium]
MESGRTEIKSVQTTFRLFHSQNKRLYCLLLCVCGAIYVKAQQPLRRSIPLTSQAYYTNPVIHADYSDPDAIRVGDDYYMVASSFNHVPGLPLLHSRNLVNWKLVGYALTRLVPYEHYQKVQHGGGVWAPSIRYHKGEFYIYYPDPDFGIYLIKSKSIKGPWTMPILVESGKGLIDPCPLWDDDGRAYLVHAYAGSRAGLKSILVVKEMSADGTRIIGNPVLVYDGHETDPTVEGPKFYKRNGYYYIFAPAGGVTNGWQIVLRSKHVFGPYERKKVMHEGKSGINGPHQGAWVDTRSGEHWFLHFQDKHAYGRVVHLNPMVWKNDWPVIGEDKDGDGTGEPVLTYKVPYTGEPVQPKSTREDEDWNRPVMPLTWQWQANPSEGWAFPTSYGFLKMFTVKVQEDQKNLWQAPNILTLKFPAEEFTATVKLKFTPLHEGEVFGFLVLGTDYAYVGLEKHKEGVMLIKAECRGADKGNSEKKEIVQLVETSVVYLRVSVSAGARCRFYWSSDGTLFQEVPLAFTAKPGYWVGAVIGMFCVRQNNTNNAGYADIDHFSITVAK